MWKRLAYTCILFFSLLFLPFWCSFILMLGGMLYFKFYLEAVILLLLSDFFLGTTQVRYANVVLIGFSVSILVLITIEFIKQKTKFYNK